MRTSPRRISTAGDVKARYVTLKGGRQAGRREGDHRLASNTQEQTRNTKVERRGVVAEPKAMQHLMKCREDSRR